MSLRFGDVIVVPFPFTDQTTIKRRPAVVISSERYNLEQPDLILMAIPHRPDAAYAGSRGGSRRPVAGGGTPQAFGDQAAHHHDRGHARHSPVGRSRRQRSEVAPSGSRGGHRVAVGRHPSSSLPLRKCIHGLRGDADGVQDTDVREGSSRAELVHRRLADAEPACDVGHGEQRATWNSHTPVLCGRCLFRSKILRICSQPGRTAGRRALPIVSISRGLQPAANACDLVLHFWEQNVAGSNPVAPTEISSGIAAVFRSRPKARDRRFCELAARVQQTRG